MISPRDPNFVQKIMELAKQYGVSPQQLFDSIQGTGGTGEAQQGIWRAPGAQQNPFSPGGWGDAAQNQVPGGGQGYVPGGGQGYNPTFNPGPSGWDRGALEPLQGAPGGGGLDPSLMTPEFQAYYEETTGKPFDAANIQFAAGYEAPRFSSGTNEGQKRQAFERDLEKHKDRPDLQDRIIAEAKKQGINYLKRKGVEKGSEVLSNVLGLDEPVAGVPGQQLPPSMGGASSKIEPIGSAEGGGTMMSDGSTILPDGNIKLKDGNVFTPKGEPVGRNVSGAQNIAAGAGAALAVYGAYQASQDKNLTSDQRNAAYAQSAAQAYQALNTSSLGMGSSMGGKVAGGINAAMGIYGRYDNPHMSGKEKAARAQQDIALAVADVYTGGLASVGKGLLMKTGIGRKADKWITKFDQKTNPLTIGLGKAGVFGRASTTMFNEQERMEKLLKEGVIDESMVKDRARFGPKGTKSDQGYREDMGADFIGLTDKAGTGSGEIQESGPGQWLNNKFAKSRNTSDLMAEDIWGYAAFNERFGKDWMGTSEENRRNAANKALEMGLVQEGKGTINIGENQEFDDYFNSILGGGGPQAPQPAPPSGAKPPQQGPGPQGPGPRPPPGMPTPQPMPQSPGLQRPVYQEQRPQGYDFTQDILNVQKDNKVKDREESPFGQSRWNFY